MSTKPTIICITPVRNEAHNLPRFLACASLWADHIIIADQDSTDGSRDIASVCPKVRLIRNDSAAFNEQGRQRLLLAAARQFPGPRLVVAMDADEVLSSSFITGPSWQAMRSAPQGTIGQVRLIDLLPGLTRAHDRGHYLDRIYVDDGREHLGNPIHSPPVPVHADSPRLRFDDALLLHYAQADQTRFAQRQVWYQMWELLHSKDSGPLRIFRRYQVFDNVPASQLIDVQSDWFAAYEQAGVDARTVVPGPTAQYDKDISAWLDEPALGPRAFSRLFIWHTGATSGIADPRSKWEKFVHAWLARTQRQQHRFHVRLFGRLLRLVGW